MSTHLGSSYKELAYLENIEKNSFRTNNDRYGCRALIATEIGGVNKSTTLSQSFEIVITKGYKESMISDSEQITKSYDTREQILGIYKNLINNRAGVPTSVMNVYGLIIEEPEYLEGEKVVVVRATMDITHRITLI